MSVCETTPRPTVRLAPPLMRRGGCVVLGAAASAIIVAPATIAAVKPAVDSEVLREQLMIKRHILPPLHLLTYKGSGGMFNPRGRPTVHFG